MSMQIYMEPVREIKYLRISLTDRCNFVCPYCRGEKFCTPKGFEITDDHIGRVVKVFSEYGLKTVRLTGGEPLLRPDIVEVVKRISLYGVEIALTTNGFFLKKLAKPLKEAGVKRLNISLDSLKEDKFRYITGGGNLNRVLEGIAEAKRVAFESIKLNTVAIRGFTEEEIDDLLKFAAEGGFHLRFIELMPIGKLPFYSEDRFLPLDWVKGYIEENYGKLEPLDRSGSGASKDFYLPALKLKIGFIKAVTEPFCEGCSKFRLTSDGKIHFCLRLEKSFDLKPYLEDENKLRSVVGKLLELKTETNAFITKSGFGWFAENSKMVALGG